jgi:hypothetical protein
VRIVTQMPNTGLLMPTDKELRSLQEIVAASYPRLKCHELEFRRAFVAAGYMFRLAEPSRRKYFETHLGDVNEFLVTRLGLDPVEAPAFLAAVIAHSDVPWIDSNPSVGQVLSIGLDPYVGFRCRNAWQGVLKGQPLLAPLEPPQRQRQQDESGPRVFEQDQFGRYMPTESVPRWAR